MTARFWCPSLFEPMPSGDGLLVRVKPPLGGLTAPAARRLAEAASQCGNGDLELTNRAAIQVRGLSDATLPRFQQAILAAGLASPDAEIERRRNLVVSAFAGPAETALAAELERWIEQDKALAALPPKFGFAIATDRDPHKLPADINFIPGTDACMVLPAGSPVAALTDHPLGVAQTVLSRFLAADDRPTRMADFVHRSPIFGPHVALVPAPSLPTVSAIAGSFGEAFALGLAFGAMSADQLATAASLAERFGGGSLRLTPWRAFVLTGATDTAGLANAARPAGFIVDRADPRLSVSACAGAPACANGYAPARADAALLATGHLRSQIHVSGCTKGCAHPGPADITLVAAPDGYHLVRHGRASDPPEASGLTLQQAARLLL